MLGAALFSLSLVFFIGGLARWIISYVLILIYFFLMSFSKAVIFDFILWLSCRWSFFAVVHIYILKSFHITCRLVVLSSGGTFARSSIFFSICIPFLTILLCLLVEYTALSIASSVTLKSPSSISGFRHLSVSTWAPKATRSPLVSGTYTLTIVSSSVCAHFS